MPFFVSGADGSAISAMVRAASQQRGADPALLSAAAKAKYSNNKIDDLRGLVQAASGFVGGGKTTEELKDEVERVKAKEYLSPEGISLREQQRTIDAANIKFRIDEINRDNAIAEEAGESLTTAKASINTKNEVLNSVASNQNPFENINLIQQILDTTPLQVVDRKSLTEELASQLEQTQITSENTKNFETTIAKYVQAGDIGAAVPYIKKWLGDGKEMVGLPEIKQQQDKVQMSFEYTSEGEGATRTKSLVVSAENIGLLSQKTSENNSAYISKAVKMLTRDVSVQPDTQEYQKFSNRVVANKDYFNYFLDRATQQEDTNTKQKIEAILGYAAKFIEGSTERSGFLWQNKTQEYATGTGYDGPEIPNDVAEFYGKQRQYFNLALNMWGQAQNKNSTVIGGFPSPSMEKEFTSLAMQAALSDNMTVLDRSGRQTNFKQAVFKLVANDVSDAQPQQPTRSSAPATQPPTLQEVQEALDRY